MTRRRFLFDENMGSRVRDGLARRCEDLETLAIGDEGAPPRGTPDPDILRWLEANGYSLVTYNRASMPVHLGDHLGSGRHVLGLFVIKDRLPVGVIIEELLLVYDAGAADEHADRITYLPLQTTRQ